MQETTLPLPNATFRNSNLKIQLQFQDYIYTPLKQLTYLLAATEFFGYFLGIYILRKVKNKFKTNIFLEKLRNYFIQNFTLIIP